MSWKKNAFSYLMWFAYAVVTAGALAGVSMMLGERMGMGQYFWVLFVVLFLACIGGIVFLLHHLAPGFSAFAAENRRILLAAEILWVAALFSLGLVLRLREAGAAGRISEYYEAAKVVEGQHIPRIVHGATYFYVQVLHMALKLLGNRITVGTWLQIILQFAAFFLMYLIVRRLTGMVSALVTLGFGMCAPYLVQKALALSPEMLYFCIFMAAAAFIAAGCRDTLKSGIFFLAGGVAALCLYLDVSGGLLLLFACSLVFADRGQEETTKKAAALVSCLGGAAVGFLASVLLDAFTSGKSVFGVASAWGALYQPEAFHLQGMEIPSESLPEYLILFGCMAFGIFSFFCHRERERIAVLMAALCAVTAAEAWGIFSEGVSGGFTSYLLLVLLAGAGLGQCFPEKALWGKAVLESGEDSGERKDELEQKGEEPEAVSVKKVVLQSEAVPVEGCEELEAVPVEGCEELEALSLESCEDLAEESAEEDMETGFLDEDDENELEEAFEKDKLTTREETVEEMGFLDEEDVEEERKEPEEEAPPVRKTVQYIENPLPLPKKHVKKVMDYSLQGTSEEDDFDYAVAEDDDFDI